MHHPFRQLTAAVTAAALFVGTWAPPLAAQNGQAPSGSRADAPRQEPAAEPAPEAAPTEEERRERARAAFQAAQQAYDAQDYAAAYEQFRVAYELVPSPHAEYWMAASLDRAGREAEAAQAYRTFLANPAAAHVGDDKITESRQRLDELKGHLPARMTVTTEPPGAQVSVDGAPQAGVTPLTLELPPGSHRIAVHLPGHQPAAADVQVQGGEDLEQRLTLAPEAPPPPPADAQPPAAPAAEPAERSMLPAYITLGLAGAGLATGTYFGLRALSDRRDFNENPTAAQADRVERHALIADMAFGIAITLGITGIVLLTSEDPDSAQTARAKKKSGRSFAVAPVVAPHLGGAAASLTF